MPLKLNINDDNEYGCYLFLHVYNKDNIKITKLIVYVNKNNIILDINDKNKNQLVSFQNGFEKIITN